MRIFCSIVEAFVGSVLDRWHDLPLCADEQETLPRIPALTPEPAIEPSPHPSSASRPKSDLIPRALLKRRDALRETTLPVQSFLANA
jgi:hypothetical protein